MNGIAKSFTIEFGKKGMNGNAIARGDVKSKVFIKVAWRYIPGADGTLSAEAIENAMTNQCPLERCAVPADVSLVAAFLVSEDGGWVHGKQEARSFKLLTAIRWLLGRSPLYLEGRTNDR